MKRKICVVITSNIHYSRSKLIMKKIQDHPDLELQVVVGGSAILPMYGDVLPLLEKDGFVCDAKIIMTLQGGSPVAMAKTTGIGMAEFATAFDNLQPDIVVVRGDRYEVMSAALAAAYLNITVAHVEGGDVTGTIDESVRHAITKLAHIHFATNDDSHNRILAMGERPDYVFNVGCPGLEVVSLHNSKIFQEDVDAIGVGDSIDLSKPYIIVMQHPVTTEVGFNRKHIEETLRAVDAKGIQTMWFWPNVDAGTDEISKGIRTYREKYNPKHIKFVKYLSADNFISLLKQSVCLVGNSSAGIKEASLLGVPVVNIGTRQGGRLRADNVKDVTYNRDDIFAAIEEQVNHGVYTSSNLYYKEGTSKRITDILFSVELYTQKRFFDK